MAIGVGERLRLDGEVVDELVIGQEPKANATIWWAVAGALFLALETYVYLRWVTSSHFATIHSGGGDPVPLHVKVAAWIVQIVGPVGCVIMAVHAVRSSRKLRALSFDALLIIGWFSMVWQDPGVNFFRMQFFYNSYWINRGSWAADIPGFLSPSAQRLPESLVGFMLLYAFTGFIFAVVISNILGWVKRRRPQLTKTSLVFVAVLSAAVIDILLELVFIHGELYSYAGAIRALSFPSGSRFQFPIYEAVLWAPVWGITGVLRYFRDERGRTALDRGADRIRAGRKRRTAVRVLAFVGLLNGMLMVYNFAFATTAFYGDKTVDLPTYMRNGICGEGTDYKCPAPGDPIPVKDGRPTNTSLGSKR